MIAVQQSGLFGFIVENIGGGEILVIAFLALVVLGPERIPDMARGAGRLINKVRSMSSDLTGDMSDVINDPSMKPIRELGELATRPRQKLAEYALEAEAEERQRRTDKALADAAREGVQDYVPEEGPAALMAPVEDAVVTDVLADDDVSGDGPTARADHDEPEAAGTDESAGEDNRPTG